MWPAGWRRPWDRKRCPWWTAFGTARPPLRMIASALCLPPISGASPASSRSSLRRPSSMPITSAFLPPTAQRRGPPTAWRARRSGAGPSTPSTPSGCRTPGLPSSTSPPRKRWRRSPGPRRRTLTRPSAGSVSAIPTAGCPPVPPRFSRSGSCSPSTTERSGRHPTSAWRRAASAAADVRRTAPYRPSRCWSGGQSGSRRSAPCAWAACTAARSSPSSTAETPGGTGSTPIPRPAESEKGGEAAPLPPAISQQKRERLTPLPYDFYSSSPVSMRP